MEEQIIVTGSRVRRKDLTTPAPVAVLTREQFQESGRLTLGEFLQTLPEQGNAPNFQLNNGGATYGAEGSTRVNLRSLGVTRTLVLVNGRRWVPAGVGASPAVDLNSIPAAAVERIEVLKDGASAVYGSDAIAGVVNVITRKTLNGTELGAEYGISDKGDAQTFDAEVTTGHSGDFGNFIFSAGFFDQKDSWLRDRSWSSKALTFVYPNAQFPQGTTTAGGSFRTPQGTIQLPTGAANSGSGCTTICQQLIALGGGPSNFANEAFIRVPSVLDPTNPAGWKLMTADDRYNFAAENYLTIPSRRYQFYGSGDAKLGFARGYIEASFVERTSKQNAAPMPLNPGDYTLAGTDTPIQLSKDSIYNPFGVNLDFAGRRLVEFGRRTYAQDLNTFRIVTGVDGTLPEITGPLSGWYWDASLNYGRTDGTFTTNGAIRNSRIADALGPSKVINGTPRCLRDINDNNTVIPNCVPLNLLGGPNNGSIDPTQIDNLGFSGTSRAFDALFTVDATVTGELVRLPTSDRAVSLALGYQYRRQSGAQIADPIAASGDSADFNFKSTDGYFYANEGFGELSIPLLANMPFVHDLEASVAGRYVNYNTFGDNFSYKFGARYTPIPDVTVRGTYSTAFRAPSISELYLGQTETAPTVKDPCSTLTPATPAAVRAQCTATGVPDTGSADIGNQELTRSGGNPNLKAETAKIYTAGIVLQPQAVRNLTFTVDYYHITVDDVVGTMGAAGILAACYPAAAGSGATPAFCDQVHRAPSTGRILFISDSSLNLAQLSTSGIDFSARYALPTPVGRFAFGLDLTWLRDFDRSQRIGATTQVVHGKGTFDLGALPEWKANLGTTWSFAGFSAGTVARYIGRFKECAAFNADNNRYESVGGLCYADANAPARQIPHYIALDLHASYTLSSPVGRTLLLVGINNVFDKRPEFVYSAPLANSDPSIYDFVGRFVYGRLQQTF
jgi:outer membrane receptor protein involved in Fe transport